ncbi:MAG: PIG-L family deacetylase [Bacteroidia bacterium]
MFFLTLSKYQKETRIIASLLFITLLSPALWAQPNFGPVRSPSSGEMLEQLRKMQVLGKVLYIAAHPDDENTRMLAWLAREKKVETAYLSLTRGDGGQNLIGTEVREGLGLIRTQELLAARKIDGARQFFTRANDFGYSKSPEETFTKWDKEALLADVVWVIRKFRPDVLITRFNPLPSPTHGHHTASAQLALEAFTAAADPTRFPEQLQFVAVWQAKRIYWNTSWWFYGRQDFDKKGLLAVDVGSYNAVLGTGYGELAAASRSMHKSQGFGAARQRGEEIEYLQLLAGNGGKKDLFEDLLLDWQRVKGGRPVADALKQAERLFVAAEPWKMLPALIQAAESLRKLDEKHPETKHWKLLKTTQLQQLIAACAGIWNDFLATSYELAPGDSVRLELRSIVRHPVEVELERIDIDRLVMEPKQDAPYQYVALHHFQKLVKLPFNQQLEIEQSVKLPESQSLSNPFWLQGRLDQGFFELPDDRWVGFAENPASLRARVLYKIKIGDKAYRLEARLPVYYRWTDPAEGERYRPVEVVPALNVQFTAQNYLSSSEAVQVELVLKSTRAAEAGRLSLSLPNGWYAEPEFMELSSMAAGREKRYQFELKPGKDAVSGQVFARVHHAQESGGMHIKHIQYPHIPRQLYMQNTSANLILLDVKRNKQLIGYVPGAGDEIPTALEALGYTVENIELEKCSPQSLQRYESIVLGVRIANTNEQLASKMPMLYDYVAAGGTLVLQYNTSQSLKFNELGPYPFTLGRGRVTVEEAPVQILHAKHPVFTSPNKISLEDFDGWVQERGLYFPSSWDSSYTALLSMHDPKELPLEGSLLYATYGKGVYIYTGLSFFRQLPSGVTGAIRLFTNLIEQKQE